MNNKRITFYEVDNPGGPDQRGLERPGHADGPLRARREHGPGPDCRDRRSGRRSPPGLPIPSRTTVAARWPGADARRVDNLGRCGRAGRTRRRSWPAFPAKQNDFRVEATVPGEDGNFDLVFEHIATDDPSASWTPAVPGVSHAKVTVRFQPDVTTAAEVAQAINDLGQPVAASLLAAPNDGSGVFADGALARGPAYVTSGGDWAVPATIGPINPPGINNAFEVFAKTNDPAHNGITAFYEVRTAASVSWNGKDTLSIRFVPGVTTVQDIVNRINTPPVRSERP